MACSIQATGHYLNQCWQIIIEILWHSAASNFTGNSQHIYPWYEFEKLRLLLNLRGISEFSISSNYLGFLCAGVSQIENVCPLGGLFGGWPEKSSTQICTTTLKPGPYYDIKTVFPEMMLCDLFIGILMRAKLNFTGNFNHISILMVKLLVK